jgi:hypothetical protein
MFLTSPAYAFMSLGVAFALYRYVKYKGVAVNWGSAGDAHKDLQSVRLLMKMRQVYFALPPSLLPLPSSKNAPLMRRWIAP